MASCIAVYDDRLRWYKRTCHMMCAIAKRLARASSDGDGGDGGGGGGGDRVVLCFVDRFDTRTSFSSLVKRYALRAPSAGPPPRIVAYAPSPLSFWISDKANLALCLSNSGLCPETLVLRSSSGAVDTHRMNDWTALAHRHRAPATRWYVKPVGQSEGRGIKVVRQATLSQMAEELILHAKAQRDYVCQREIHPPLLVRTERGMCKFDVRFYVIVDTEGECVVYPDARVRCANGAYDADDTHPAANVCNTTLQSKLLGVSPSELVGPRMLSEIDNGEQLIKDSMICIRRAVHLALQYCSEHGMRETREHAARLGVRVYSALGVDIGFDVQGRPWIIEVNKRPAVLHETYYHRAMAHYVQAMLGK